MSMVTTLSVERCMILSHIFLIILTAAGDPAHTAGVQPIFQAVPVLGTSR